MDVDHTCSWCGMEHALPPDRCPNWGRTRMPPPRLSKQLTAAQQVQCMSMAARVNRLGEAIRQRAADEVRERTWAKTKALLREVLDQARQADRAVLDRDLAAYHEQREAQRLVEAHNARARQRRDSGGSGDA